MAENRDLIEPARPRGAETSAADSVPMTRAQLRQQRQTQVDVSAPAAASALDPTLAPPADRAPQLAAEQAVPAPSRRALREATERPAQPESKTRAQASIRPEVTRNDPVVAPKPRGRRILAGISTFGVMGIVGAMAIGMTTPVAAVTAGSADNAEPTQQVSVAPATETAEHELQAYVTASDAEEGGIERDANYETSTLAEVAAASGILNISTETFVNDPTSPIQWPFSVGVPISSGFGMRWGRMHEGLDFTPGLGAPIQAIADGTVRVSSESGGAYGVHVIIDHEIDGELVSSHYAHMQYGSLQVVAGQHVTVGTVLGHTGNTGRSYGAHTHFEILMNGTTAIDPLPWLREQVGG